MRVWLKVLAWTGVGLFGLGAIIFVIGPALFASVAYPLPSQYQEALSRESQAYGISPNFLAGLIFVESRWNPNAHSSAAAGGLTQFIPSTARAVAKRLGVEPFEPNDLKKNPQLAIKFGAYYISDGIKRYGGDKRKALIAYNGGGGAVTGYEKGYPYKGTLAYANKVLATETMYDRIYGEWWKRADSSTLVIKSQNPVDLLTTISIGDFWRNLLFNRDIPSGEAESTDAPDFGSFWNNILGN